MNRFFLCQTNTISLWCVETPALITAAQIGFPFVEGMLCAGISTETISFRWFKIACRLFAALRTVYHYGATLCAVWPSRNFVCAAQRGSLFSFESRCENIFNCDASLCQKCRSARCLMRIRPIRLESCAKVLVGLNGSVPLVKSPLRRTFIHGPVW